MSTPFDPSKYKEITLKNGRTMRVKKKPSYGQKWTRTDTDSQGNTKTSSGGFTNYYNQQAGKGSVIKKETYNAPSSSSKSGSSNSGFNMDAYKAPTATTSTSKKGSGTPMRTVETTTTTRKNPTTKTTRTTPTKTSTQRTIGKTTRTSTTEKGQSYTEKKPDDFQKKSSTTYSGDMTTDGRQLWSDPGAPQVTKTGWELASDTGDVQTGGETKVGAGAGGWSGGGQRAASSSPAPSIAGSFNMDAYKAPAPSMSASQGNQYANLSMSPTSTPQQVKQANKNWMDWMNQDSQKFSGSSQGMDLGNDVFDFPSTTEVKSSYNYIAPSSSSTDTIRSLQSQQPQGGMTAASRSQSSGVDWTPGTQSSEWGDKYEGGRSSTTQGKASVVRGGSASFNASGPTEYDEGKSPNYGKNLGTIEYFEGDAAPDEDQGFDIPGFQEKSDMSFDDWLAKAMEGAQGAGQYTEVTPWEQTGGSSGIDAQGNIQWTEGPGEGSGQQKLGGIDAEGNITWHVNKNNAQTDVNQVPPQGGTPYSAQKDLVQDQSDDQYNLMRMDMERQQESERQASQSEAPQSYMDYGTPEQQRLVEEYTANMMADLEGGTKYRPPQQLRDGSSIVSENEAKRRAYEESQLSSNEGAAC